MRQERIHSKNVCQVTRNKVSHGFTSRGTNSFAPYWVVTSVTLVEGLSGYITYLSKWKNVVDWSCQL